MMDMIDDRIGWLVGRRRGTLNKTEDEREEKPGK
jgi:hypothetical protein